MSGRNLARELSGIVVPLVVTMIAAALALRGLNALPAFWSNLAVGSQSRQSGLIERLQYPDIESAESDLRVKVAVPSYFPSYLVWPPSSVRGQREPARVVSLLFRSNDAQQALQIREIFWAGEELPFPVPGPVEVLERREVEVNGAAGQLTLGRGQGSTPVNQLRWHDGGVHVVVTTLLPAEELLRISRSIHLEETVSH